MNIVILLLIIDAVINKHSLFAFYPHFMQILAYILKIARLFHRKELQDWFQSLEIL